MTLIDNLLKNKPLGEWQAKVIQEGRNCEKCGAEATITAPVSDTEELVRINCPVCGNLTYEFPPREPMIINFADIAQKA